MHWLGFEVREKSASITRYRCWSSKGLGLDSSECDVFSSFTLIHILDCSCIQRNAKVGEVFVNCKRRWLQVAVHCME